ncbi:D-2-hydroxyacid dehydrogenase [Ancylobacter terrae]|uniref:D-2-hydroxyacid dehydrogenase n=1 Tax=Ancylobacter sp. sgz301288 TaxID=3342077 RepID=UPI0038588841
MKNIRIHVSLEDGGAPQLRPHISEILRKCAEHGLDPARLVVSEGTEGNDIPPDCEVLFSAGSVTASAARAAAPGLRWMQLIAAGAEKHMADYPAGLLLTNASGVHAAKGGEYALAGALMIAYHIPRFVDDRAAGRWEPVFGPTLSARTVTLLGTGAIGTAAARALRPTGCTLIGINRAGSSAAPLDRVATSDALDEILPLTDILISTLPLTTHTRGLIDRRRIDLLPEQAGVVVLGRAKVLDYEAIYDRLEAGTLAGAVLEVFPQEPPPPDDRVWKVPRLVLSPHCNVDDHSTYIEQCIAIFARNLARYVDGRPLENLVDPALGY